MNRNGTRLNIRTLGKAFALSIVVSACLSTPVNAASPNDIINQMLSRGFNAEQANLLFGQWSDTKQLLIGLAKSGNQEKIKLAHDIVSQHFSSWEQTWTSVMDHMVKEGDRRPVDARTVSRVGPRNVFTLLEFAYIFFERQKYKDT